MPPECVIVMPVYNEAECIREVCLEWLELAERRGGTVLLAVDDGSRDATPAVLEELAREHPALKVVRQDNAGHGSAVLRGYRAALETGCEWVFQVDSDGQFQAGDFDKLWACRDRSNFILGRRAERHDHPLRIYLSAAHRLLLRLMFGVRIKDPNVPYRLMRASFLARLLAAMPQAVFAPNVFLSILARRAGEDLCDVPVRHLPRETGTVTINGPKMVRVMWRCFREVASFRRNEFARFRR